MTIHTVKSLSTIYSDVNSLSYSLPSSLVDFIFCSLFYSLSMFPNFAFVQLFLPYTLLHFTFCYRASFHLFLTNFLTFQGCTWFLENCPTKEGCYFSILILPMNLMCLDYKPQSLRTHVYFIILLYSLIYSFKNI